MTTNTHTADGGTQKPHRFAIGELLYQVGKVLFVAILFLLFFLLAHSMVSHRFFAGGWYNQNGTIRP